MSPASDTDPLPDAAELLGLDLPPECLSGVRAALAGLGEHLRTLEGPATPGEDA